MLGLARRRSVNRIGRLSLTLRHTTTPTTTTHRSRVLSAMASPRTADKPADIPEENSMLSPYEEMDDKAFVGMSGGQIFAEMMKRMGVKHVFGYPGGAILLVFDGIYNNDDFEFILPRHEQGAGHMAEGYAKATGKPGIVIVTSGPGATNTVTPLQDALSDGVPIIVFTGQVPTTAIGSDAFQEADVVGITRPCTKWNTMVTKIADLPRAIREAFHIANSGRPGPVLVDLPKDVTAGILRHYTSSKPCLPSLARSSVFEHSNREYTNSIEKAARLINNAKQPLLYVGQGMMHGHELVRELAQKGNIPVTTTLMGMGTFDEMDSRSLHMLGMHGSAYANYAMQDADVIVSLGARFDDRVTGNLKSFAPAAKLASKEGRGGIIHFDVMPKNINKTVGVDVAVVGDGPQGVADMLPLIKSQERTEWFEKLNMWKTRYPFTYKKNVDAEGNQNGPLKPQMVLEELNRQLQAQNKDYVITTGVGQHQMWAAQYIRWRHPRTFLTSGGLGTMGFGLPAAVGAKVACPDKIVIDIDGDASLSMTAMELQTASEYNIGVKILLLNNDFQGMVKQWQDLFYDKRYSATTMINPNWVKLTEAMHATGIHLSKNEDVESKIAEFLACDGPVLMDCVVDKHEHVYPLVPAGKGLEDMILGPDSAEPYKAW